MTRPRNNQRSVRRVLGAVTALVTATVVAGVPALPASAGSSAGVTRAVGSACGAAWSTMWSPNPSTSGNELLGVDGVSATDVWAVGGKGLDATTKTLTLHWNGSKWIAKPSPTVSGVWTELYSVAAVTASNAWAVGFSSTPDPIPGPAESNHGLILHWNGSVWTKVANPLGSTNNELLSVFALSASNVYAAGFVGKDGGASQVPLVLHYDGNVWKKVTVRAGFNAGFKAIGASAAGNVWAVGWRGPFQGNDRPFAERFDGSAWHIVSPSSPASGSLNSVLVFGPKNVWAAGGKGLDLFSDSTALAERFNGSAWSKVNTAADSDKLVGFDGIAAASASSIWAVGSTGADPMGASTLIEYSTGSDFSRQSSPAPGTGPRALRAVVAFGTREFAVGIFRDSSSAWRTLVLRRCG